MRRRSFLFILICLSFGRVVNIAIATDFKTKIFRINSDSALRCSKSSKSSNVLWLVIHQNEVDAAKVMHWAIKSFGGKGYELLNLRRRNRRTLRGGFGYRSYLYDPNRIFSDIGIQKTIYHHNIFYLNRSFFSRKIYRRKILPRLRRCRKNFLTYFKIDSKKVVIALHNNRSYTRFSIKNYSNKKNFYYFINPKEHPKNFVLVTWEKDFKYLISKGVNVVWQKKITSKSNDGSLSIYCAKKGFRYFNIESRFNDRKAQKRIIQIILEHIR